MLGHRGNVKNKFVCINCLLDKGFFVYSHLCYSLVSHLVVNNKMTIHIVLGN